MSDTVIQVENLGKKYIIGHQQEGNSRYVALRDVLSDGARALGHRLRHPGKPRVSPNQEEFWALKDVSFEVKRGEVVGIIGRNGAGKSTLLKILSRITEPTEGRVRLRGRVASLLEVGTGFHPELTGRENIFLNGAILGMSRAEINRKFDEIVDFAEVERFLDTPVKRYSSGMYVRLAFAVAAHLEPEILVVDEVLAVGDTIFQKKCLGKMEEVGKEGRTVLFVSHQMSSVKRLCNRAILLHHGKLELEGESETIVSSYLLNEKDETRSNWQWKLGREQIGNNDIRLIAVRILNPSREISHMVDGDKNFFIEMEYEVFKSIQSTKLGFILSTFDGIPVLAAGDIEAPDWLDGNREPGLYKSICRIPGKLLNAGVYGLTVSAYKRHYERLFSMENLISFEVELLKLPLHTPAKPPGILCIPLAWEVKQF